MDKKTKEIFCITQEECAEVTQAISKIFRFGFDSVHPVTNKSNMQSLEEEVGDLLAMIDLLVKKDVGVDWKELMLAKQNKFLKLKQWSNIEIE